MTGATTTTRQIQASQSSAVKVPLRNVEMRLLIALTLLGFAVSSCKKEPPPPEPGPELNPEAEDKAAAALPVPATAVAAPTAASPTAAPAALPGATTFVVTPEGTKIVTIQTGAAIAPPPPGKLCEVEMTGRIADVPVPAGNNYVVYVGIKTCMGADAYLLTRAIANPGGDFFAEVFVACGTQLALCGAVEKLGTKSVPTKRYAVLGRPLLAEGIGEIEYKNLRLDLQDGPEITFPALQPVPSPQ